MIRVVSVGFDAPLAERVELEKLPSVIHETIEAKQAIIVVARGAWHLWNELRQWMDRKGLNWLLVEPLDPLEANLAKVAFEQMLAARMTLAGFQGRSEAPSVITGEKRVTRRELLREAPAALTKYVDGVWVANTSPCSSPACPLCTSVCPYDALEGKPPRLDAMRCAGCGLCLSACPYRVLWKNSSSPHALWDYIRYLPGIEPGLVVYACRDSIAELLEGLKDHDDKRIIVVPVVCPGDVTLDLLLAPHLLGLRPVIYCPRAGEECGKESVTEYIRLVLSSYQSIVGEEPLVASTPSEVVEAQPGERLLEPWESPPSDLMAAARLAAEKLLSKRGVTDYVKINVPLVARHELDANRCTLCGACAAKCPMGALSLVLEGERESLVHDPSKCIACKTCEAVCPEDALRVVYAAPYSLGRRVLHAEEVVKCRVCGRPVGPKRLVESVASKLRASNAPKALMDTLYLCEECRRRRALGLLEQDDRSKVES
ncbi:hypothetical protein Pyrfu_1756 [Pyrolobus fumarii 1A]|uniref:4Fe-4S ferredoxin-type domain-containing protein n=1 Tax=Pyrolobus fumarii (strain DSM 11204 / 1A) TaxID=694429 RepID=G0ECP0_PYRF1|nr:4Fe-4S binding protein [Pyrolobus fumarii]AEM39610.1 hypothetical protein Pyrfu_1756 [Pyrolobus fumarii 1A]